MFKIKHIVWDWNGTLVDDGLLFVSLMNKLLLPRKLNPININIYREKFCFPLEKYYKNLGFDLNKESYNSISAEFIKLYGQHKYDACLYFGALKLLKQLAHFGIKNYLLSAQNQKTLIPSVRFYGLGGFFEKIIGLNNYHARGKEFAARVLLTEINAKKGEILFVGDTWMDIEMGINLGCSTIALTCGHNADFHFKKFKNLQKIDNFTSLSSYLISKCLENR